MDKAIYQFIDCVSMELGVDVRSQTRLRNCVEGRQLAMYFLRTHLPYITLKRIGGYFGGKGHATVLHSLRVVEDLLANNKRFQEKYIAIKPFADKFLYLENEDDRVKVSVNMLLHENAMNWSNIGTKSRRDLGTERDVLHRWNQIKQEIRELSPATYSQIVAD